MANILGINLSEFSAADVLKKCQEFLSGQTPHYLVTPNSEIVQAAHQDEEFFYILNKADLAIADGFGLKLAGWLFGQNIPRVTGADLTIELLKLAQKEKIKVAIVCWRAGLSNEQDISQMLTNKFPGINTLVLEAEKEVKQPEIIKALNNFSPQILFVTFGFPAQEKFIYHNLKNLSSIRLALGVGGSFDFLTKKTKRAPRLWRFLGLESFWRLIMAPRNEFYKQRCQRIYRATFIFIKKILRARFISRFLYRPNVACLLYKSTPAGEKILIVEREDEANHWQLPQGGTDGEPLEIAGTRELREELGTDKFSIVKTYPNLFRYNFSKVIETDSPGLKPNISNIRASRRLIFDYKGQKQGLLIARFTGQDEDIKINFWDHQAWRWVEAKNLAQEVHACRQKSALIFLEKFNNLMLNQTTDKTIN